MARTFQTIHRVMTCYVAAAVLMLPVVAQAAPKRAQPASLKRSIGMQRPLSARWTVTKTITKLDSSRVKAPIRTLRTAVAGGTQQLALYNQFSNKLESTRKIFFGSGVGFGVFGLLTKLSEGFEPGHTLMAVGVITSAIALVGSAIAAVPLRATTTSTLTTLDGSASKQTE